MEELKPKRKHRKRLSIKQEKFCLEYVRTGNATRSYIEAGYSADTYYNAEANGRRQLNKPIVKERIDELMSEIRNPKIADATEVLEYLTAGMRGELQSEHITSAGTIVNLGYGEHARTKCAELLGKRYRLFVDKQEVDTTTVVRFVGEEDIQD